MLKQTLNKGISTPIAIGIILILVILVAGFTWWQYGEMWRETGELPETELSEKKGAANWETYRNENLGYEIKYPKEWITREKGNRLDVFHPQNIEEANIYGNVLVQFFSEEEYENFYEQQIDLSERDQTLTFDEITIDGANGFKGVSYEQIGSEKSMFMLEFFPNKENTGTFRITVWAIDLGNETYQEQTKSIISTFKFLD